MPNNLQNLNKKIKIKGEPKYSWEYFVLDGQSRADTWPARRPPRGSLNASLFWQDIIELAGIDPGLVAASPQARPAHPRFGSYHLMFKYHI